MKLTQKDLLSFEQAGYLLIPSVFDANDIDQMAGQADFVLELIINSSVANKRPSRRLEICKAEVGTVVRKIQPINDLSVHFTQLAKDSRLVGPISQIMGCECGLVEHKLNYKQPLTQEIQGINPQICDDGFSLHNDWAYFSMPTLSAVASPRNAPVFSPDIISCAILIDTCHADSGPIQVWPGTHKEHIEHQRNQRGLEVKPGLIAPEAGIDLLAPAGSIILFHALLIHNSSPNTSSRPRRILLFSYKTGRAMLGVDSRSGAAHLLESPYEWEYCRMKNAGLFSDVFEAPKY